MVIYIASDGQARLVSPQHVYQGSSVTDVTVIAPFPSQTAMAIAFSIPDGKEFGGVQGAMQTPPYIMTLLANQSGLPDGVQAWQYVMTSAITQNAGQAKVSVTAQFAQGSGEATLFTQQTSAQVEFTIEPSTVGTLPDEPTEDAWKQVLAAIGELDGKILAAQNDISDIENGDTTVGKAKADQKGNVIDETYATKTALAKTNEALAFEQENVDDLQNRMTAVEDNITEIRDNASDALEYSEQAFDNSESAVQTANQAKTTADGLANSITQANATASQANATAQEAKEIAEGAAQGNGTRVSVGGAFQPTLSFTSDPQTQIDALLPTSVTDTSRASGQWVVGTGGTPESGKTMLLGTFSIYDTNIWLHISGGVARGGSSNYTTDVNVFISSLQGTVNEACCYVRKLYTSSRTTGIYYAVDSSRNLRIYAAVPQHGKMFVSAEVSGGSIVGKGSSEDTYPSGGAYLERKDYAAELKLVQPNNNAAQTGWYRIAAISDYSVATVKICEGFSYNKPSVVTATIAVGYAADGDASISVIGEVNNRWGFCKIRVCMKDHDAYIDLYNGSTNRNTVAITIEKAGFNETIEVTDLQYIGDSDTIDGFNIVSADFVKGINTSGGVYQKGSPVFATDPSKLNTSPLNGWTYITATGSLPSDGVYMVTINLMSYGIGIMVYTETKTYSSAVIGIYDSLRSIVYDPNPLNDNIKWHIYDGTGKEVEFNYICYKRIV